MPYDLSRLRPCSATGKGTEAVAANEVFVRPTGQPTAGRAAWACAKAAGDPDLLAVIKGIQSSIAY